VLWEPLGLEVLVGCKVLLVQLDHLECLDGLELEAKLVRWARLGLQEIRARLEPLVRQGWLGRQDLVDLPASQVLLARLVLPVVVVIQAHLGPVGLQGLRVWSVRQAQQEALVILALQDQRESLDLPDHKVPLEVLDHLDWLDLLDRLGLVEYVEVLEILVQVD